MLLCLDVGNTQIHGGVFEGDNLVCQFRKSTQPVGSTDELGIFFVAVLRENTIYPRSIERIALCSVVPAALHPIRGASKQYFGREPFVLQSGVKTGLKVKYRNPIEVGADRIAGAIAASQRHPGRNLIIVDCGTATTFDVVTAAGDYLGGVILPGIGVSAETLASRTAKLPARRDRPAGDRCSAARPIESIQSGLYHGHTGAIRHIVARLHGARCSAAKGRASSPRAASRVCSRSREAF
jgi:type III pantothenate kinase